MPRHQWRRAISVATLSAGLAYGPLTGAEPAGVRTVARQPNDEHSVERYQGTQIVGETEVDRALKRCPAVAAAGVAIGGAIDLFSKRKSGGGFPITGVAAGGIAGAAICGAMIASASHRDKERVRTMQLEAANSGHRQERNWRSDGGEIVRATVSTTNTVDVVAPKSKETLKCRRTETRISVGREISDTSDVICLVGDRWVMADQLKDLGIRTSDIRV